MSVELGTLQAARLKALVLTAGDCKIEQAGYPEGDSVIERNREVGISTFIVWIVTSTGRVILRVEHDEDTLLMCTVEPDGRFKAEPIGHPYPKRYVDALERFVLACKPMADFDAVPISERERCLATSTPVYLPAVAPLFPELLAGAKENRS